MRVWDLDPVYCRVHLLGEHKEIHAVYNIVKRNKQRGYYKHPEVLRWHGKLDALKKRHDIVVAEMTRRGYNHFSPINLVGDCDIQDTLVDSLEDQMANIEAKFNDPGHPCTCCIKKLRESLKQEGHHILL